MEPIAIAKLVLIVLVVALASKTLLAALFFKVRDAKSLLIVMASQYLTATFSAVVVGFFAPSYIVAHIEYAWIKIPSLILMFIFSVVLEAFFYSAGSVTKKPYTMALVLNAVSFGICIGLSLVGILPAVF